MFTGITEETAQVIVSKPGTIALKTTLTDVSEGDSLMVDGVCLTVSDIFEGKLTMDVGGETLRSTALKNKRAGKKVNIERSLSLSSRIHGHIVYGHVMKVGKVTAKRKIGNTNYITIESGRDFTDKLMEKGSVAVNGVSLTVNEISGGRFSVAVIPQTLKRTNLGDLTSSDPVNLEADMIIAAARGRVRKNG